jgi:hypothetical protein
MLSIQEAHTAILKLEMEMKSMSNKKSKNQIIGKLYSPGVSELTLSLYKSLYLVLNFVPCIGQDDIPIKIRPDREFKFHVFKEQVDYPHRMMLKLGLKHIYEYSIGEYLTEEPIDEIKTN